MRSTQVLPDGSRIRWTNLPGREPARVYVHGLGAMSAPYFAPALREPGLVEYRSLLVDLLGFGTSDRPLGFGYTLEEHAEALAVVIEDACDGPADLIGHSMGGAVAIVLAARRPELVAHLVLIDANLDPVTPGRTGGAKGISRFTEPDFLEYGRNETLRLAGPHWAATMRLAGPEALYRSGYHLARGTSPTMRVLLRDLTLPRTFLYPAADGPLDGGDELTAAGVSLVAVPDCGHNIMLDNPTAFARALTTALTRPAPRRS